MQVFVERSQLVKSLGHMSRVVDRRNSEPILANVLLEVNENGLLLKATDLEMEVSEFIPVIGGKAGSTTVGAQLLHDIVRKMPDGSQLQLELVEEGRALLVAAGLSQFKLACLSAETFPSRSLDDFTHSFTMKANELLKLIKRTQFAISTEETRYYLTGIFLHTVTMNDKAYLKAVSTDGHRLVHIECIAPAGCEDMPGVIIPRKVVNELDKLLSQQDDLAVQIDVSNAHIKFTIGNVVIVSKLIDGNFPDYARLIPFDNSKDLRVNSDLLAKAVERVSTVLSDRSRAVKFSVDGNKLSLSVVSNQTGSAEDFLDVDYASNTPFEIGFNPRFVTDVLSQIVGEDVVFKFGAKAAPVLIKDLGSDDVLYVLMPMVA